MTADMDTQNEYDENGLPGPGAPTPLSSLEVGPIHRLTAWAFLIYLHRVLQA